MNKSGCFTLRKLENMIMNHGVLFLFFSQKAGVRMDTMQGSISNGTMRSYYIEKMRTKQQTSGLAIDILQMHNYPPFFSPFSYVHIIQMGRSEPRVNIF